MIQRQNNTKLFTLQNFTAMTQTISKQKCIAYLIKQGHNPAEVEKQVNKHFDGYMSRTNGNASLKKVATTIFQW